MHTSTILDFWRGRLFIYCYCLPYLWAWASVSTLPVQKLIIISKGQSTQFLQQTTGEEKKAEWTAVENDINGRAASHSVTLIRALIQKN